ncbi:TetR/AcrR family transcriptional regulator [Aquihabitans sp. G128]|uniref:TetR/AcrR family transcriptional regulator n=1 Tax=Aquihabitans sp. G128 TaxID=2849779 RepID=UPI001C24F0B3|nr:TetR/AcrR family transcriptional regulator [Aquihabitans sp. G128]QXC61139.1 TetR/AcrR family transcriptional regulator [Aquihabitans sp. G128]
MTDPAGNRRGRETRRRILAVAEERFAERGIELTLDEVARAAATTRMTVHRHTGGREALVTHLVLRATGRLAESLRAVLDADAPFGDRLVGALLMTVSEIRSAPHLTGLFTAGDPTGAWPVLDPDDRVLAAIHAFFEPYLAAAAADGLLRHAPEPTLDWLLRQVLVFVLVPVAAPTDADVREQLEAFVLPAVLRAA